MPKPLKDCCTTIWDLLRKNKLSRATISAEFFRQIVERQRLETVFITALNDLAMQQYRFGVIKLDPFRFLVFKTTDKYLKEDPYAPTDED